MEFVVKSRRVQVSTTIHLSGMEPIARGVVQWQPVALHITYSAGLTEPTWKITAFRLKKNGDVGESSRAICGFEHGNPEWLTEQIEKHRPATFDI